MNTESFDQRSDKVIPPVGRRSLHTLLTDGQLLTRYSRDGDDITFAAIVRRFGPLVLGVCRRILNDARAAEDAFHATFLLTARKANTIHEPELFSHWIYSAACKVATRIRQERERIAQRNNGIGNSTDPNGNAVQWQDTLDPAICRLPKNCRIPLILCCFNGSTCESVARTLKCSTETIKRRLARTLLRLQKKLPRYGLSQSASALAKQLLPERVQAEVPLALVQSTCEIANNVRSRCSMLEAETNRLLRITLATERRWLGPTVLLILPIIVFALAAVFLLSRSKAQPSFSRPPSSPPEALKPIHSQLDQASSILEQRLMRVRWQESVAIDQPITSIALSPHGNFAAVVLKNGSAISYEVSHPDKPRYIGAEKGPWCAAAFSPDEKTLALVSAIDQRISLFVLPDGIESVSLKHAHCQGRPIFASSELLVCRDGLQSISIWQLRTKKRRDVRFESPLGSAWAISTDGEHLAVAHNSGAITLCRIMNGKIVRRYMKTTKPVHALVFSREGDLLVGCTDAGVFTISIRPKEEVVNNNTKIPHLPSDITSAYFGLTLDKHNNLWAVNRDGVDVLQQPYVKRLGRFTSGIAQWSCFAISHDGGIAASVDGSNKLCLWEVDQSITKLINR